MESFNDGPRLRPELRELDNNLHGKLRGDNVYRMAARFARAGWRTCEYASDIELVLEWAELYIEEYRPGDEVHITGVVDPARFDDLVAALEDLGIGYELELYDADGNEIDHRPPLPTGVAE